MPGATLSPPTHTRLEVRVEGHERAEGALRPRLAGLWQEDGGKADVQGEVDSGRRKGGEVDSRQAPQCHAR